MAPVTAQPSGGNYDYNMRVDLRCATPQIIVMMTVDGSDPRTSGTAFASQINPADGNPIYFTAANFPYTHKLVARKFGEYGPVTTLNWTPNASAGGSGTVASTPRFGVSPATYATAGTTYPVQLSSETPAATSIRWTINGTIPSATNGNLISGASGIATLPLGQSTLRAIAIRSGYNNSAVAVGVFTIIQDSGGGSGVPPDKFHNVP
ncbi:MAG: chitobiase/beta-hexosaminidase C-terminal domain-containing protein [Chthoniobacterales bacterium]